MATDVEPKVRPLVERLEAAAHAWEWSLTVGGDYMPSPAMLREAKAEIESLRQDAERYRWLRENKFIWSDFGYAGHGVKSFVGLKFEFETDAKKPSRLELDAAIDAAIRARGEK